MKISNFQSSILKNLNRLDQAWWLTLVIPTTQGGRQWEDWGLRPARTNTYWDPMSINKSCGVIHPFSPSYAGDWGRKISVLRPGPSKNVEFYLKNNWSKKRAGSMAQMVEHLPRKHEAVRSNSSTTNAPSNQKKKKKVNWLYNHLFKFLAMITI
jgi:hypothetical protein